MSHFITVIEVHLEEETLEKALALAKEIARKIDDEAFTNCAGVTAVEEINK